MFRDLISCVGSRSGSQGEKGALGRRRGSPELCSAAALQWSRLNSPFPGSNRPAPGAGVIYTPCVIHLGSKRRSGKLGAALAWAAAGLRGGAPRYARSRVAGARVWALTVSQRALH